MRIAKVFQTKPGPSITEDWVTVEGLMDDELGSSQDPKEPLVPTKFPETEDDLDKAINDIVLSPADAENLGAADLGATEDDAVVDDFDVGTVDVNDMYVSGGAITVFMEHYGRMQRGVAKVVSVNDIVSYADAIITLIGAFNDVNESDDDFGDDEDLETEIAMLVVKVVSSEGEFDEARCDSLHEYYMAAALAAKSGVYSSADLPVRVPNVVLQLVEKFGDHN